MSSSLKIPSTRSEFNGFGAYYEQQIAPFLSRKERGRRKAIARFVGVLAGSALLIALLFLFDAFGQEGNIKAAFVVVGLGGGGAIAILNHARENIAKGLFNRICARFNFTYQRKLKRPAYYSPFKELDLLPNHNRETWEDEVRGSYAGAEFVLCEANLKYTSGAGKNRRTRTVFHGQLFVIDYPRKFLGETVVKRDFGVFNRFTKPGREFTRVGLASPRFEKAFEAWSTDQVEARDLLDPIVLERFLELERLFDGKKLRAAFFEERLFIAIESGDRLNMGSMFKPLEDTERVESILKEFDLIFDLIDVAVRRVDRPIDGAFSVDHVRTQSSDD